MQKTLDQTALTAEPGELVLCVPAGWESYISLEFYEIQQGLVARGWNQWVIGEDDDAAILHAISNARSALLWEAYELFERHPSLLASRSASMGATRRMVFCDDVHYLTVARRQRRLRAYGWADLILATYPDKLIEWYPEVPQHKIHWLPHAAASYFQPSQSPGDDRILLSGARTWPYPFRQFCYDNLPATVCNPIDHPGYPRYPGDQANRIDANPEALRRVARAQYASILAGHPAALVCGSIFGYLVAKVFETMAAGGLLIAERNSLGARLAALGFIDGEHYIGTDLLHVIDVCADIHAALRRGDPRLRGMARTARARVAAEHTTAHRAARIHHLATE